MSSNVSTAQAVGASDMAKEGGEEEEEEKEDRPQKEHSRKRVRLLADAHASIETRCPDSATALEVDLMVLDYLAYQTTRSGLESRSSLGRESSEVLASQIAMADGFLAIFRARHTGYEGDAELRFRMLLLSFVTLYTQRLTRNCSTPAGNALGDLRSNNALRARTWIRTLERVPSLNFEAVGYETILPISPLELVRNRAHVLSELQMPAEDPNPRRAFYGTQASVSLLDILPLFMHLSAARNAICGSSSMTVLWMEMASEFMLQASLEQYLVYGTHGADAIDEAFAWGTIDGTGAEDLEMHGGSTEQSGDEVSDMFKDSLSAVGTGTWETIKNSCLDQLFPSGMVTASVSFHDARYSEKASATFVGELENVAAQHPIAEFDDKIFEFLQALSESIAEPVLVQLEKGQLAGMSREATDEFLQSCGLNRSIFDDTRSSKPGATK